MEEQEQEGIDFAVALFVQLNSGKGGINFL